MFLAIEIGGTKLQLAVGSAGGDRLVALERLDVEPELGAERIRQEIERVGTDLFRKHAFRAVGIGFGGPVDSIVGRTITSHQVDGWDEFPLVDWCQRTLGLPTVLGNDSDLAGLAEARFGAGEGHRVVFYSNVGSGVGGALVTEGQLYQGGSGVASEIGQLRPGLQSTRPDQTVEAIASGWGIADTVQARLSGSIAHRVDLWNGDDPATPPELVRQHLIDRKMADEQDAADLAGRCDGRFDRLDAKMIARAAIEGNDLAREAFCHAAEVFGWGIAQMITLLAPNVVVIGGGVSLVGDGLFLDPLREHVRRYVFPPLIDTYEIVPAAMGEEVVLHGALTVAESSLHS